MTKTNAFERFADRLEPVLASAGFATVERSEPGALFTTRIYASAGLRLRLSSSGGTIALEADRLPNEVASGPWLDVTIAEFEQSRVDDAWISACAADFERALRDYLEQWAMG